MDPTDSTARYKRDLRLWWLHWIVSVLLGGVVLFGSVQFANSGDPFGETDFMWLLRYSVICLPGLFLVQWATAVMFGRKSRPWHFKTHPADRKPRRPGAA